MTTLDCSHYQGAINWMAVKASGKIDSVIVKVTDGPTGVDANWKANHDGARSVNLPVAPYHFSEDSNATAEANHFAQYWAAGWDFRPWLDEEKSSANASFVTAFRSEFRSVTGYQLFGVYSSESLLSGALTPARWIDAQTGIWAARYASALGWDHSQLVLWQYTSAGSVPGIGGSVDLSAALHGWTPATDHTGTTTQGVTDVQLTDQIINPTTNKPLADVNDTMYYIDLYASMIPALVAQVTALQGSLTAEQAAILGAVAAIPASGAPTDAQVATLAQALTTALPEAVRKDLGAALSA